MLRPNTCYVRCWGCEALLSFNFAIRTSGQPGNMLNMHKGVLCPCLLMVTPQGSEITPCPMHEAHEDDYMLTVSICTLLTRVAAKVFNSHVI